MLNWLLKTLKQSQSPVWPIKDFSDAEGIDWSLYHFQVCCWRSERWVWFCELRSLSTLIFQQAIRIVVLKLLNSVCLQRPMIPEHDTAAKFDQKYHELEEKMKKDSWFYGQLSRIETESIFRSADFDRGVYLLRKKSRRWNRQKLCFINY